MKNTGITIKKNLHESANQQNLDPQRSFRLKARSAACRQVALLYPCPRREEIKREVPFSEALHDALDCREACAKAALFYGNAKT